ncbi:hypothetical protein ACP70R_008948 [Stipagrostis hirtigluma subsp. patula]
MCGILAVLGCADEPSQAKRARVLELSRRLKHRGPDWSGLRQVGDCYLSHQRLAIIDPASGDQPLYNEDQSIVVAVNGEIYNHEELRTTQLAAHIFRTGSDCEVIAHLYEEHGEDFVDMLDGVFSFVLLDTRDRTFLAARDAVGVTPLYVGWAINGSVWIASEMKALHDECEHFDIFPPGHLYSSKNGGFRRWYNPPWFSEAIPSVPYDPLALRKAFEKVGNGRRTPFWEGNWLMGKAPRNLAPSLYKLARFKHRTVDRELQNYAWIKNLVGFSTQEHIDELNVMLQALQGFHLTEAEDQIYWKWTAHGEYTASSAYQAQFLGAVHQKWAQAIWRADAEPKCKFFAWLVLHNKANTAQVLAAKNWPHNELCSLCSGYLETGDHMLRECSFAEAVWQKTCSELNLQQLIQTRSVADNLQDWVHLIVKDASKAVIKRLMTDVPFGVLLSGGLDSSLVAAVTIRHLAGTKAAKRWGTKLHSFCVGLEGSPDLKAAKEVADYLGTEHHEFHFTVQDGIDAIEDVIYHTETYDVTTIRASTPMFLMSRKIKALGVKMVISGEGSDEIFGGYLYFHKAPNKEEFHRETCRKIKALHQYDCLRANKATSAWGLEARVPFLDKEFINEAMSIDPEWKMVRPDLGRIEKWVLRKAFDDEEQPFLPKHILYRQKEQFSDGVGYSWIDGLKAHAASNVTDKMLSNAKFIFPHNTPTTKEAYYYRMIFERFFPQKPAILTVAGGPSVACSTAKAIEWDAQWSGNLDPSGRAALGVHLSAYESESDQNHVPTTITAGAGANSKKPRTIKVEAPGVAIEG